MGIIKRGHYLDGAAKGEGSRKQLEREPRIREEITSERKNIRLEKSYTKTREGIGSQRNLLKIKRTSNQKHTT